MGHRVIRGALIPSNYIIGSTKKNVSESIAPQILTDRAMFGLSAKVVERILTGLTDSTVFGVTKLMTRDLKNNLTESIVITNT